MKCYLLLRNNEESGPYSLEELKAMHLMPDDLLWEEGGSTAWKYPTEIDELQSYISIPEKQDTAIKTKSVFVSMPLSFEPEKKHSISSNISDIANHISDDTAANDEPQLETRYRRSFDEIKETYAQRLQQRKKLFYKRYTNVRASYWIAALFFGAVGAAFVVKEIVDNGDAGALSTPVATAIAIPVDPNTDKEITNEASTSIPLNNYQNALVTEQVPQDEAPSVAKNAAVKTIKPKSLNKEVSLKSNDYHVGLFGGVKDLKLSLYNNSNYTLDRVAIKVLYLKPNGQTLKEDRIEVKSVPAKGTKTISVPSSNRGVKVKYQIIHISSDGYQKLLET